MIAAIDGLATINGGNKKLFLYAAASPSLYCWVVRNCLFIKYC